jgi:hypothetical protein
MNKSETELLIAARSAVRKELEWILCLSWQGAIKAEPKYEGTSEWEDRLKVLGCVFIRNIWVGDLHRHRKSKFVLARLPYGRNESRTADYCIVPSEVALKIVALKCLPVLKCASR